LSWFTPKRLALVMLLPFMIGLVRNFLKPAGSPWFMDFDAVSCAGVAVNTGQPIYAGGLVCPGARPTSFIYTPVVAHVVAVFERHFGVSFFAALYGAAFCLVVAMVARVLLREDRRSLGRLITFRQCFYRAAWRASDWTEAAGGLPDRAGRSGDAGRRGETALCSLRGIVAVSETAGVAATGAGFRGRSGSGGLLCLLPDHSARVVRAVVESDKLLRPPRAAWRWLPGPALGVFDHLDPGLAALYVVYATLMIAAGLALAHLRLSREMDRLALGIAICLLLYPRLTGYDLYTLPVGMGVAVGTFRGLGRVTPAHLSWALCVSMLTATFIGGRAGSLLATRIEVVLLLCLTALALMENRTLAPVKTLGHLADQVGYEADG
jgi:hypothetical protein